MDLKKSAIDGLKGGFWIFLKDLQSLPEEAFSKCMGGATRTVADIVYEVNMVNDHVGMTIRGETPFDWPDNGWIKAPADFQTKEVVIAAFEKSSQRIIETVEAFTPERFEETVQTEHGEKTCFERCQFMNLHLWYHSGQLNFIQTLLGDDKWNWK